MFSKQLVYESVKPGMVQGDAKVMAYPWCSASWRCPPISWCDYDN